MGKKVKVAAFGLGYRGAKTQCELADTIVQMAADLRNDHPDLIVFPEAFLHMADDKQYPDWEALTARTLERLCALAKEMRAYIIAPLFEAAQGYPGKKYNTSYLIDRSGQIVGKYSKRHPVVEEMINDQVLPGSELPVFDTDFGRIGIQCCFDIGWRDGWQQLADAGAQLVVWVSAYDGGSLLNAYAAVHMYHIVSSVWSSHTKIIDPLGCTLEQGSIWNGLALGTIDLETTIFHIDRQGHKISDIRRELGDKVTIRSYSEMNVFTIESNDEEWPMERIIDHFGLISYKDYHAEATREQQAALKKYPAAARG